MTAGVACFEESGGECLTAKRTFRNGHVSVRCRQSRSVPFSCIKGDAGAEPGKTTKEACV